MRRVVDARSPRYDPQSATKKLGPWGSGTTTLDEMLEELEDRRMEDLRRDKAIVAS